ncbi:MAG: translocation/assembly module TamB domain-containing protein [Bacteroidales bacterium]|nr:translocation/assembly module TamB domain-containing protein [Bacteroidales bacterium]
MQTAIVSGVVEKLAEKMDGKIVFEKIHLKPFTTLVLKNAAIVDDNPAIDPFDPDCRRIDTLFRAEYIIARFSLESLFFKHEGFHLKKAYISNAQMNLVLEDDPVKEGESMDNITKIFRIPDSDGSKPSEKEIFHIDKVEINNMGFAMISYVTDRIPYLGGINWNDLDVRNIKVNARDLNFTGGVMSGIADHVSFTEKSGYICHEITGRARVGNGKTIVEDIHLTDPWSDLDVPLYMMSYSGIEAFQDFIGKVKIDGKVAEGSRLSFKTLSYFAPALEGVDIKASVSGGMSGCVDDFKVINVKVKSEAGGFAGTVNGRMTGIPDIENTTLEAEVSDFHLTADGLGKFVSEWMPEGELDFSNIAKGVIFMADAKASGHLNHLNAKADLKSFIGNAKAEVSFRDLIYNDGTIGMTGRIATDDLDLGKVLGTDIIHQCTVNASASAELSTDDRPSSFQIDTLLIDRLNFNNYNYSGIAAVGEMSSESFNGTIVSHDPNLNFIFQGGFAKSAKSMNTLYKFHANIGYADLNALNLDKRGISKISLSTNADFLSTNDDKILGKMDVKDISLENSSGKYHAGDIHLNSFSDNNLYKVGLDADFADGSFKGTAPIGQFAKDLINVTLKKELPALFKDSEWKWEGNSYDLDFTFHNVMEILPFIMPGAYIEKGTSIEADMTSDGYMSVELTSGRIAYKENYLKGITLHADNSDNNFGGELKAGEIRAASLLLRDNSFQLFTDDNHIGVGYTYDNHEDMINRGEFILNGLLDRDNDHLGLDINIRPSTLYLNSREWQILPSDLRIDGEDIIIGNLELSSGEQRLKASGKTSTKNTDTLRLNLDRFDISILNPLIDSKLDIKGALTGHIRLVSPLKTPALSISMLCDSTEIAGKKLGILSLGCDWNEEENGLDIGIRNDIEGKSTINATGKFIPKSKALKIAAEMERMEIGFVQPLLPDIFSEMSGTLSGKVMLEGPMDNLSISSEGTRIDDAILRVAYTNVPYFANGTFHLDNTGAYFDDVRIRDRFNGTGTAAGSINWDRFKNIHFDTRLKVEDMECIDLDERMADVFYGHLFGSGNISITGPVESIRMNIDAVTTKAGELRIPITSSMTASGTTNLLKFKEAESTEDIDPYEVMVQKLQKKEAASSDFVVKLHVNATPDVTAFIEIDKANGNILSGSGSGIIDLEVSEEVFDINGDYTINNGNYRFSAMGMVNRDFVIQEGSSLNFNGDIMESDLDIKALYKTKASLSTLLADSTSVANRRTVECGIHISDKLLNPKLDFSIEIPDLDPMIASRVQSALSTDDKVQKQFLSLILSNSFLPDEQSGIVNNSSLLYSNVTEVLTNQLNNIFMKLDIPLDLGLKYQPNEKGNDIFDVAVSTQLFNNRVIVNGNLGNKQYSMGNTQNEVVGDLDIEIKLDRSGAVRLNVFSHSADQFSNYLDNSQRNGVGVTYQTEFNSFGQFLRNIFSSKSRRQEAKRAEEQAIIDGGMTRIDIEKPTIEKQAE